MQDLTGMIFERLKVLHFDKKSISGKYFWKCKCVCGKIVSQRSDSLKSGKKKSCGCIHSPDEKEYINNLKERLMKYSETKGDCREWKKRTNPNGYGLIKTRWGMKNAPRASWIAHKGAIPNSLFVLHKCDNRLCINPKHLFLGTHKDNMDDMKIKKRQNLRPGELHHINKMTNDDVLKIRESWDTGKYTQAGMAREYKVCVSCIHNIVRRKSWTHI